MAAATLNRLWIVEKPSMAACLLAGMRLGLKVQHVNDYRKDGYYHLSNGDGIAPLLGHLVQKPFLTPEQKAARLGERLALLPIRNEGLPDEPRPDRDQGGKERRDKEGKPIPARAYTVVTGLMRRAKEIVNAGDVDREGQLIVDELLLHVGIDPTGRHKPVWRMPLVSTKEEDIAAQLGKLERNGDPKWVNRRMAALARQTCDGMVGANGSLAYQDIMNHNATSVGRVQSPVLAIVVQRDLEIESFMPHEYYVPVIMLADGTEMRWHRREGSEGMPGFDLKGRITDRVLAQQIVDRVSRGLKGTVTLAESKQKSVAPPLPFSATVLASTVAKRYGLSPKEAERAAQSLYERHKAISYVGTDCRFLPTSLHSDARQTLAALADGRVSAAHARAADPALRGKAFNDDKVDEHYAIIPTGRVPNMAQLDEAERSVFETVAKRFVAQFHPDHLFIKNSLAALFGDDEFRSSSRQVVRQGWKEVEGDVPGEGEDADELDSDQQVQANRAAPRGPRQ